MEICGCLDNPGDCCYVAFCPCLAFKDAADNIGDANGMMYCLLPFLGLTCCAATLIGNEVSKKGGFEYGMLKAGGCAYFDGCVCFSCRMYAESKDIKAASEAPASDGMKR